MDQQAIEDLFERNADMRLLEFRHNEPGKGAPANKRTAGSFGAESIVSSTPDAQIEDAPRLRVTIAAAPKTGVIPGAVVGVAVDVFNDGTAPAPESKLLISIPVETEYRAGSLRVDGREPQAPEQLFAQGLPIARLPGATSSKVTFQLGVLPGVNTLYLQPRLQTNGVPVVGTAGITIKRGSTSAAPAEPERPFYELDAEETVEAAANASAEPILPPVMPPVAPVAAAPVAAAPVPAAEPPAASEPPPAKAPPAPAKIRAAKAAKPAVEAPAPKSAAAPEPAPVPEATAQTAEPAAPKAAEAALPLFSAPATAPAAKTPMRGTSAPVERMIRYRTLANNDIALLDRLFTPEVPGIIAHYVMISSIACCEAGDGEDAGGYGAFLRRDIELLGRALVHSRMGKAPQYRIVQSDLDGLSLPWQQLTPPQSFPVQRRLRRELRKPEWQAIGALTQPSERDATLRTRIALLALAGSTFDGVERRPSEECESGLAAYRASVLAWLVPLCVASAGAESFVIPAPPTSVDTAGRKLVAALKSALTS